MRGQVAWYSMAMWWRACVRARARQERSCMNWLLVQVGVIAAILRQAAPERSEPVEMWLHRRVAACESTEARATKLTNDTG